MRYAESFATAGVGALFWAASPFLGAAPSFASIEHLFLFVPLVCAPLALLLLPLSMVPAGNAPARGFSNLHVAAQQLQPFTAAGVVASFMVPRGPIAGVLALGWLMMAGVLFTAGFVSLRTGYQRANPSLLAAHIFLLVGAILLFLFRLGFTPFHFTPTTVLLGSLHFHYSGFVTQVVFGATVRRLQPPAGAFRKLVVIAAIAGVPLIAVGNVSSPELKFFGVTLLVLSLLGVAILTAKVAFEAPSLGAKALLLASSIAIAIGMILAGIYGVAEPRRLGFISIPQMAQVHGTLNALGFALCGLVGHLHLRLMKRTAPSLEQAPAA